MNEIQTKRILSSIRGAQPALKNLNKVEREKLEKRLDVEHAYYSSSLEGSKICKKDFEELGKKVK